MTRASQLIVFSDLDGTLLDHDSYSWEEARPAVEALERYGIPLVPVSSKTAAELQAIRDSLGSCHPYIVENGASIFIPPGYFTDPDKANDGNTERMISSGPDREALGEALARSRRDGNYRFETFAELGARGIAKLTGLDLTAAGNANDRTASEPLHWQDSEPRLEKFVDFMAANGLRCVRGGRFVHVMGQFDKADAVAQLLQLYALKYKDASVVNIVLGDGPNDLQMLSKADIAVVVKARHAYPMPMPLPSLLQVIHTVLPGPAGWNAAIMQILRDFFPNAR